MSTAITRDELFKKVWSIPTTKLATELGVSDVMIAKYCRKMDVPKPPPGYWARVHAGWKPKVPALPKTTDQTVLTLYYAPTESDPPTVDREFDERLIPPVFAERLDVPHVLVAAVTSMGQQQIDLNRLAMPKGEGYISLDVSRDQLDRALRIADALFKSFEANGYAVDVYNCKFWGERTRILKEGCCAYLSVSEKYQKEKRETQPGEKRKPPYLLVQPETYAATGKLSVKMTHGYSDYRKWNDRQNDPLESRLKEIVSYTARIIEADLERKQAEEEIKRLRIEAAERSTSEVKCREELLREANDWDQADKLRRYLNVLEKRMRTDEPEQSALVDEYLSWAMSVVDALDPLVKMNSREQLDGKDED